MCEQKQSVIVMSTDLQVLKGLVLLLEDMELKAIPVSHKEEIVHLHESHPDCAVLLLLPFEFGKGESGFDLVMQLRASYVHCTPAILLSHENCLSPDKYISKDIFVLSNQIKPDNLRRNITAILASAMTV